MGEKTSLPTDAETNSIDAADRGDEPATYVSQDCGALMRIIDTFLRRQRPWAPPTCKGES